MSEKSDRKRFRAEGREYGMSFQRGTSAQALDTAIQEKVSKDFRKGICSKCRKRLHDGNC